MAKKSNIGLGLAALAVGAGAVAAATKGHKAEVKKEERKAAVKAAKRDYRNKYPLPLRCEYGNRASVRHVPGSTLLLKMPDRCLQHSLSGSTRSQRAG